jgi:hypothetical protein
MSYYAIAVVAPEWTPENPLAFTEAGYNRWKESIEPGTRVLIFKAAPVNALVAEGEVHDTHFLHLTEWPMANVGEFLKSGDGEIATYVLPIRILYTRENIEIPLETIHQYVDAPQFPHQEWLPIDLNAYNALTNWP